MATAYDEIAYPTTAFRQTHPDRLAAQAALFGLPFAPVASARVLDIGGGDGANLIPLAVAYPQGQFVGFDLAASAVARGREVIQALGLTNIRLETRDLMEADFGEGGFDYIIAHGVYAWIPEAARNGLMASIRHHLAPTGLAFVSYNALPGGHVRRMLREMLLYEVRDVHDPAVRLQTARAAAQALIDGYSDQIANQRLAKSELGELIERPLEVLAHDDLGEVYNPVHLHEFAAHAGRHGLQFLTEASLGRCGEGFRPPYAVDDEAFDIVAHAQGLDFKVLRSYREDILARAEVSIDRRPMPARMNGLWAATPARPVEGEPGTYDMGQKRVKLTDEALQAAVGRVGAVWPAALPVAELELDDERAGALLRLYWTGALELHTEPPPFARTLPERPAVSPLARLQAARGGPRLTTLRHTTIEVGDPVGLKFIASLGGDRTVDEIARDMSAELGVPEGDMKPQIETKLADLLQLALLR